MFRRIFYTGYLDRSNIALYNEYQRSPNGLHRRRLCRAVTLPPSATARRRPSAVDARQLSNPAVRRLTATETTAVDYVGASRHGLSQPVIARPPLGPRQAGFSSILVRIEQLSLSAFVPVPATHAEICFFKKR